MFTRITVPLDGSPFADQALPAAAAIARRQGAALDIVHVHAPRWRLHDGAPTSDLEFDLDQRRKMRDWLTARAGQLTAKTGLAVETASMIGEVAPSLERHVRERHADLVVMATHGRGGISRAWLGSVVDRLLRDLEVPLLLLRPTPQPARMLKPGSIGAC